MTGCGTAVLTDPEDFRVNLPGVDIDVVWTNRSDFRVRATWIEIGRLRMTQCNESAPRVALVTLAPGPIFISFPIRHQSPPIWNGLAVPCGEIVLHGCGDRVYQRTSEAGRWGVISVPSKDLAEFSRALTHMAISRPAATKVLRPPSKVHAALVSLHKRACRLAETKPDIVVHGEVPRSLKEDLLYALVNCLVGSESVELGALWCDTLIMGQLETELARSIGALNLSDASHFWE
jgi:hypothetical protein